MCTINAPHRHDTVGSFLRPERLKKARNDFEKGKIDDDEPPQQNPQASAD